MKVSLCSVKFINIFFVFESGIKTIFDSNNEMYQTNQNILYVLYNFANIDIIMPEKGIRFLTKALGYLSVCLLSLTVYHCDCGEMA